MRWRWFSLPFFLLPASSPSEALPKYVSFKPTLDQVGLLLLSGNVDRIFVDLTDRRFERIQIISKDRLLYTKLLGLAKGEAAVYYGYFVWPDASLNRQVKAIQLVKPTVVQILLLLHQFQPLIRRFDWTLEESEEAEIRWSNRQKWPKIILRNDDRRLVGLLQLMCKRPALEYFRELNTFLAEQIYSEYWTEYSNTYC